MEFVLVIFNTDWSVSLIISTHVFLIIYLKILYMGSFLLIVFIMAAYCETSQPIMHVALYK